jgi:RNA polymerase sigma factor (sigma-70 family)
MNNTLNIPVQYTDAEVIQQVLLGNTALFEILIRRYNALLYKTGRAYGFNHQDTEDLMQETYVNAYQHLCRLESGAAFKTWLVKIMLHQCYHKMQKRSCRQEKKTEMATNYNTDVMDLPDSDNDTPKTLLKKELNQVIESSIQRLPDDYRLTFALRELSGLSVNETAVLMNTTTANVKVRLNRARIMLRREIEQLYSPADIYEFNLIYCDKIVTAVMNKLNEITIAG